MRFLRTFPLFLASALMLVSCASERNVTYSRSQSGFGAKYMSDVKYERQADGTVKPNQDVRSQYDGKQEYLGGRDFSGKDYTTAAYSKKRWGGDTKYANKKYAGATDASRFQHSPHFVQQQANAQGQLARMNGQHYAANNYQAGAANVAKRDTYMDKPSDAETNVRRRVFGQPEIMSKEDYRNLSVEQSRTLLGR